MERGNEKYPIGQYATALWKVPYHFLGACKWYLPSLSTLRLDEIVDSNAERYDNNLDHHLSNFREFKNVLMGRERDFNVLALPKQKEDLESRI